MKRIHGGYFPEQTIEYDFSVNVNPLGLPEVSKNAITDNLSRIGSYPDPTGNKVKNALVSYMKKQGKIDLSEKNILLGNGAAEFIYTLCYTIFHGAEHVANPEIEHSTENIENRRQRGIVLEPGFSEYAYGIEAAGGEVVSICAKEENDFIFSEKDYYKLTDEIKKGAEIVFICNPNNPTGYLFDHNKLLEILSLCNKTNTILCVDECFMPFCEKWEDETLLSYIGEYENLCILRAMTKYFAMSGLRMGFLISCNENLLESVKNKLQPWNTSIISQEASVAALLEDSYIEATKNWLSREKRFLINEFQTLGLKIYQNASANFVFFKGPKDLQTKLFQYKIAIRSFEEMKSNDEELAFFRVGIRTRLENEKLIEAIKEVL